MRFTPPANARSHRPERRLWQARSTVTREDEQAVSTARAGPCRPSAYAKRPAATLNVLPVPV